MDSFLRHVRILLPAATFFCLIVPPAEGYYGCYRIFQGDENCGDYVTNQGCLPGGGCTEQPSGVYICDTAYEGPGFELENAGIEYECEFVIFEDGPAPFPITPMYNNECGEEIIECGSYFECVDVCEELDPGEYECQESNSWSQTLRRAEPPEQPETCDGDNTTSTLAMGDGNSQEDDSEYFEETSYSDSDGSEEDSGDAYEEEFYEAEESYDEGNQ